MANNNRLESLKVNGIYITDTQLLYNKFLCKYQAGVSLWNGEKSY